MYFSYFVQQCSLLIGRYKEGESNSSEGSDDEQAEEILRSNSEDGCYWALYRMIQKKEWKDVEKFVRDHPNALTSKIDTDETLLDLIIRFAIIKPLG